MKRGGREDRDATALQRKIFSRWCRQKLLKEHIDVTDIVTDCKDGVTLLKLVEALSEKKYPGRALSSTKMRVKQIDNLNNVLKFVFAQGIEMKIKPQAEDFVDGREKAVLGLIWSVMLKFMKIGDPEEGTLNAKDALLMWANNKTAKYDCGELNSFKDFKKDGKALCAIIHKHRPALVDYDALGSDPVANTKIAMDAALKYFQLEQYLTPEEFMKLDENSMVVYVSEYYYGIAEQRRIDNAVRRISKVIKYTKENDALKADFAGKAEDFKKTTASAEELLGDRTIDNTMAGAKRRIEQFYEYKKNEKNRIIGLQLNLESLYNSIAMRLAQGKRPDFQPGEGLSLKDISGCVAKLEEAENGRKVALHAELNRQIKLVRWDEQHTARFNQLKTWFEQKEAYLKTKEVIESVSEAQLQLAMLDSYESERKAVWDGSVSLLKKLGADLASETYERTEEVQSRESDVDGFFSALDALCAAKRPVLEDDLAREEFKVVVRLQNKEHVDMFDKLKAWIGAKTEYLNAREECHSVKDARDLLSLLSSYDKEKVAVTESDVAALKELGEQIRSAKYETEYSTWVFEHPEEVSGRESTVDGDWSALSELSQEKQRVLDDHLAREEFAARVRTMNQQHVKNWENIQSWYAEKEAYLNAREDIHSVKETRTHLSLWESYEEEKQTATDGMVANLKTLGADILAQKYETTYSTYVFENPSEIAQRESKVDEEWTHLDELSAEKKRVLDDHLAREEFAEKLRRWNVNHTSMHDKLQAWIADKEAYLNAREDIHSVTDAETHISLWESYVGEKALQTSGNVAGMKELGARILEAKYETTYSTHVFDNFGEHSPEDITAREAAIDGKWTELDALSEEKKRVLDDHLARELFAEKLRTWNANHTKMHDNLQAWIAEKEAYLNAREDIHSVTDAQTHISLWETYVQEKALQTSGNVAALKSLGARILEAKYETTYSTHVFDNFGEHSPEDITNREAAIDGKWTELDALSEEKKRVLDDHLARELFAEKLRTWNNNHTDMHDKLQAWIADRQAYLSTKEVVTCISEAQEQLSLLASFRKAKERATATSVASLKKLGEETRSAKYETTYSTHVFDNFGEHSPEDITARESAIDGKWVELDEAAAAKQAVLEDDLAREKEKERLRLLFAGQAAEFVRWTSDTQGNLANTQFGFTLAEVEAYKATLDADHGKINAEASAKKEEYEGTHAAMTGMGVKENVYTSETPASLEDARGRLEAALADTVASYEAELQRQRENDALCKQFADAADGFAEWITTQKTEVTASKAALEEQLSGVEGRLGSYSSDGAPLENINALSAQMEEKGITTNRHTNQTATDVEVLYEQYKIFLERKKEMLETAIEHEKLRGVDQETMDEIEENFNQFDDNKDGSIEYKELRACLYSLGEEKTKSETEAVMTEFGKDGKMDLEGFKEFMITIFGVSANKEDIFEGFDLIKRGDANITEEKLDIAGMETADISYIKETAPGAGDGHDDRVWTEDVFAR